jgi:hypothetical protein
MMQLFLDNIFIDSASANFEMEHFPDWHFLEVMPFHKAAQCHITNKAGFTVTAVRISNVT